MRYRDGRRSICLSSQSGCPLTCTFCATGAMSFARNLTASEILDQALHFRRIERGRPLRVHGHGRADAEPRRVLAACERLPDIGITHRRTTISTVGWIPGIERLTERELPLRLALSLHAADEALRSELMPVNERYPLRDVLEACRAFYARKRRRVFVEYVMLAGVNDRYEQALALATLLAPGAGTDAPPIFKVNLIPYNPTELAAIEGSSRESIAAFRAALESRGVPHGAPDARARHRRRLRPARGERRLSTTPATGRRSARASPARSSRSRSSACSSGVGSQRATSGSSLQRAQAEQLQELGAGAVEDGAELRAAGLLDQAALEQRGGRRVGADTADARDLRPRDRLQVGDDRERLGLRGGERRRCAGG